MSAVSVALATTWLLGLLMVPLLGSLLRSGVPGVREWLIADVILVAAMPCLMLRGHISDFMSIVVPNILVSLASVTMYAGFARFLHRPPRWPLLITCVAIIVPPLVCWTYIAESISARVAIATGFTAATCIMIAAVVWRHRVKVRIRYSTIATVCVATVFAGCQVARGAYFLTLHNVSNALTFETIPNVLLLCVGAAITPVLLMCGMMMVHDTLLFNARDAANRDFLTGALSREGFASSAALLLTDAERRGSPLTCLIIDLDHFKAINDTFGHSAGDKVLREFVELVRAKLHPNDVMARIGGEEFVILMPGTTLDRALVSAEKLRNAAVRHVIATDNGACTYSISGGLASKRPGESLNQLMASADRALYQAKISGRNRLCTDEQHVLHNMAR
jgi:diguanylate cyclase (GGDEF)-like protein